MLHELWEEAPNEFLCPQLTHLFHLTFFPLVTARSSLLPCAYTRHPRGFACCELPAHLCSLIPTSSLHASQISLISHWVLHPPLTLYFLCEMLLGPLSKYLRLTHPLRLTSDVMSSSEPPLPFLPQGCLLIPLSVWHTCLLIVILL